ncbi:hypothetical protein NP590_00605 [Methylomonas sp. SURF-2]|uniref:Uncharacterized protein n=1 Tax=Methylomonas subterranea TaxID=2952225 RepID=A0ABT1TBG5_9GAMM|nr:hypothetical protein [Methylomonas sp. SURF-2]MCQ8102586.1 hypothetical protein [Methylomonas sp. SURF-2]
MFKFWAAEMVLDGESFSGFCGLVPAPCYEHEANSCWEDVFDALSTIYADRWAEQFVQIANRKPGEVVTDPTPFTLRPF